MGRNYVLKVKSKQFENNLMFESDSMSGVFAEMKKHFDINTNNIKAIQDKINGRFYLIMKSV